MHFGLQTEEARREILTIHATSESAGLGVPLFASEEQLDAILQTLAKHTEYFTPRYLAEIANVAKSHLLERVAKTVGRSIGLTESALQEGDNFTFSPEDWIQAFEEVGSSYDTKSVQLHDKRLREFVHKHMQKPPGFRSNGHHSNGELAHELYAKLKTEVQ